MQLKSATRWFILDPKRKRMSISSNVRIYNFPKYLDKLRESYGKDKDQEKDNRWWLPKVDNSPEGIAEFEGTVILDDIGVEKNSEWVSTTLYTIINGRYENERPTILISNLNIKELADKVDDRIVSRITEMCIEKRIEGGDRRVKIAKDRVLLSHSEQ